MAFFCCSAEKWKDVPCKNPFLQKDRWKEILQRMEQDEIRKSKIKGYNIRKPGKCFLGFYYRECRKEFTVIQIYVTIQKGE